MGRPCSNNFIRRIALLMVDRRDCLTAPPGALTLTTRSAHQYGGYKSRVRVVTDCEYKGLRFATSIPKVFCMDRNMSFLDRLACRKTLAVFCPQVRLIVPSHHNSCTDFRFCFAPFYSTLQHFTVV